jgi:hypothetical protein
VSDEGGSPGEAGRRLARMLAEGIGGGKLEIRVAMDNALLRALQAEVRRSGGDPAMFRRKDDAADRWVLVKHWHDSGGVQAVYGPYAKEHADWLRGLIGDSCEAWTVTELLKEPEL